jgi:hypothetical protein
MPNRQVVPRTRQTCARLVCALGLALATSACRSPGETTGRQAITEVDAGPVCDPPTECPPGTELVLSDTGDLVCGTPSTGCSADADCGSSMVCFDGECVVPDCTTDGDCKAPALCVAGSCEQPACDACPAGFHCVTLGLAGADDHACVPDQCTGDAGCPSGLRCIAGTCTDESPCTATDDCVLGTCVDGLCHTGCTGPLDCGAGQVCDPTLSICRPPCTSDAACGTGYVCTDRLCYPDPCAACTADQVCVSGQCLTCTSIGGDGYGGSGYGGGCSIGSGSDAGAGSGSDAGPGPGSDGGPGSGFDAGGGGGGTGIGTVAIYSDWGTGYCAMLTVTNNTTAVITWQVTIPVQGTIYGLWNGVFTQTGGTATVHGADWNGVLQPGQSTNTVGFCASR